MSSTREELTTSKSNPSKEDKDNSLQVISVAKAPPKNNAGCSIDENWKECWPRTSQMSKGELKLTCYGVTNTCSTLTKSVIEHHIHHKEGINLVVQRLRR